MALAYDEMVRFLRLRYGEVEEALMLAFAVPDENVSAFKAKIRHMRNVGLPDKIRWQGKGTHAIYTFEHLLQMAYSIELQYAGFAPSETVDLAITFAQKTIANEKTATFCTPSNRITMTVDLDAMREALRRGIPISK